jgi:hypothetical protein
VAAEPALSEVEGTAALPIRLRTSSAERRAMQITFWRLVWPEAMVTEDRGCFKSFAKNSMQALLARPSTGGEIRDSFSASPSSPVIAFFLVPGWTFTPKVTPLLDA